jgi:hypothetical protein
VAAEHAPRSAWLGSLKHVIYYGFYELDQNQLDLLDEVRRRTETTVFFPFVEAPDHAFSKDFLESRIAPMASTRKAVKETPRPALISQVTASGAADEVEEAAREVLRLADSGIPLDAIGVVARTLDPYAGLIESAFHERHIPFTSGITRRLDRDPAVKAARLLFSIEPFRRADVIDLLRSPAFKKPQGDPDLWDRASRLMGIGLGVDEWRRRLGTAADTGKDWEIVEGGRSDRLVFRLPREEVVAFWTCVRNLLDAPPAPKGWKAFSAWARERAERFLDPDPRVIDVIESLEDL